MFGKKQKKSQQTRRQGQPATRSSVFSYYNNRPVDTGSTKQRKRQNAIAKPAPSLDIMHHINHLPTYIAIILVGVSFVYALTLDTNPKVLLGKSSDSNTLLRSSATYQTAISAMLEESIFNRSKLTLNTETIAAKIQKKFPEIQQATVSLPFIGRRPVIGLDPAEPALSFVSGNDTFIMANDGRLLIRVSDMVKGSAVPKLPTVQDESSIPAEQGEQVLPKENVTFITTVLYQLSAKKITVDSMQLPKAPNELRARISGTKYYVKFSLVGDARVQSGAFLAVYDRLKSQNVTPAEYIDVRVEDRVYFK